MKQRIFLSFFALSLLFLTACESDDPGGGPQGSKYSDLSSYGTANSYIINKEGLYSFNATVMGNGVSTEGISASTIRPVTAELLWQDAPGLVSDISIEDGKVCFQAGSGEGNALIAVRDESGEIAWSWHIWRTNYNPQNDMDSRKMNGISWMDRNLGATTSSFDEAGDVKGMVYQWGRKDPFPSVSGWTDYGEIDVYDINGVKSDILKTELVADAANLQNAITNPTVFYSGLRGADGNGPYDWYTTTDYTGQNDYLWETKGNQEKTMFDPCPPGWRVPKNTAFKGLNNNSFPVMDEMVSAGREHEILGYFPASGTRGFEGGIWVGVGTTGDYQSSTANNTEKTKGMVNILHFIESFINARGNQYRASGIPVRCVSEKEEADVPSPGDIDLKVEADRLVEAAYIKNSGNDGSASYYIGLSNVDFTIDVEGQVIPKTAGEIVYLDIYAAPSKDSENAVLPEGTYSIESSANSGNATTDYTWIRYKEENSNEIKYYLFNSGEIVVKHTANGAYDIEGNFISKDGLNIQVLYKGEIAFTNRGGEEIQTVITNPVDVTFELAEVYYEHTARDDNYDRYSVDLWAGEFNEMALTDGYRLRIDLMTEPASTKDNMQLEEGIYTVSDTFGAGHFLKGDVLSMMGYPIYIGTYCQEVRPTNKAVLYGFANSGTVEIKRSGDQYEIIVDYTTPENVSVKGRFPMGDVSFFDKSPEIPDGDWLSILHDDKDMTFDETHDVYAYGNATVAEHNKNLRHFKIYVNNHTLPESFYLSFMTPENATSPVGEYTVAADPANPVAGEFIPGFKNKDIFEGTWCYILWGEDNYEAGGAPATEGTLSIKDAGKDEYGDALYAIEFDMKDDAEPKHAVTGGWTGPINLRIF